VGVVLVEGMVFLVWDMNILLWAVEVERIWVQVAVLVALVANNFAVVDSLVEAHIVGAVMAD